jgi:beta-lactamase superfamily II metal-dependent hydrolase
MKRLKEAGVALYRTDKQGTITVTSDGKTLQWDQEACTDFSSGDK